MTDLLLSPESSETSDDPRNSNNPTKKNGNSINFVLQKRETADVFRIFLSRSACVCGSLFTLIPSSPINISRRRRTFSSRGSSVDWISWDLAFILKREREYRKEEEEEMDDPTAVRVDNK